MSHGSLFIRHNIPWLSPARSRSWAGVGTARALLTTLQDTHWAPVWARLGWESPPGPGTRCDRSFSSIWGWVRICTEWSAYLSGGSLRVLLRCGRRRREAALAAGLHSVHSPFLSISNPSCQQKKAIHVSFKRKHLIVCTSLLWLCKLLSAHGSELWPQFSLKSASPRAWPLVLPSLASVAFHTLMFMCTWELYFNTVISASKALAGSSLQTQLSPNPSHLSPVL